MSRRQREEGGMGWGSLGTSGSSGGSGSSHGAKFGKKLDFEGLGSVGGSGVEAGGGSSSDVPDSLSGMPTSAFAPVPTEAPARGLSATGVAAKRAKGVVQGGQQPPPPMCQVEGCHVDLKVAKAYYYRHKVCGMHSKAPKVIVAGLEQRFCQQCSRFHQLAEFDQGKRSCRRRLAGHNERRRKPPPGSLQLRHGHLRAPFHEDNGRDGSYLVDFSHPKMSESAKDVWPTIRADDGSRGASSRCQDGLYTSRSGIATNMTQSYMHGSAGGSVFSAPKLPAGSSFEVSSSGCALSLLSSDPRGTPATTNRAPTNSRNNHDGPPLAQAGASASYTRSAWSFHETSNSMPEIRRSANFGQATERGDGDSCGELGLAPRGNKECIDSGHGRIYDPGNSMH